MTSPRQQPPQVQPGAPQNRGGLRVGSIFGIDVYLDSSLLLIFALLVYLLGAEVFPDWHPDWPAASNWSTAVAAGLLFFASVLAHELAHALVSRRFDIEVKRITLFLFGGIAQMEEEPREPRAELLIAIAGPVTSLVLGITFIFLGTGLAGENFSTSLSENREEALAGLSPLATLMLWLGPVNMVLGLFNMIPGFPLDGGRVFRALIWWISGDLRKATQVASDSGRLFGWFLMILGVMQALSGMVMQGLWLLLIGWFLANAASMSYKQLVLREQFRGVTARDLMRAHFETVTAQLRLAEFIDEHLLQSSQLLWPVVEDSQLIGLITLDEVKDTPEAERASTTVGQVMRSDLAAQTLAPDTDANQALLALTTRSSPLAIVENNRVIGLLSEVDVMKRLALRHV